jgi:hypothetical protein
VELLQNMEFPKLDGNPLIDNVINKCWHNKYVTVSEGCGKQMAELFDVIGERCII